MRYYVYAFFLVLAVVMSGCNTSKTLIESAPKPKPEFMIITCYNKHREIIYRSRVLSVTTENFKMRDSDDEIFACIVLTETSDLQEQ